MYLAADLPLYAGPHTFYKLALEWKEWYKDTLFVALFDFLWQLRSISAYWWGTWQVLRLDHKQQDCSYAVGPALRKHVCIILEVCKPTSLLLNIDTHN